MPESTKGCPNAVNHAKYGCLRNKFEKFTSFGGIIPVNGYITWYILPEKPSQTLSPEEALEGVSQALAYIEPHMGKVKFKQVDNQRDAQIVMGFYQNSDSNLPEQFEQNTLAYAYLGNGGTAFNIVGDMFFNDENFNWSLGPTTTSIDFTRVYLHECLHSLGLSLVA